jgi:hypothetical protein
VKPVPYYVKALALSVPAILLGLQFSGWIGFIAIIRDGHPDFRNLYTAGYMVQSGHGHELYDYDAQKAFQDAVVSHEPIAIPFIRPACQALLFVPFSLLPFRLAYFAFLIVNLFALAFCFRLLRPYMRHLAEVWPGLPHATFFFLPIAAALMQGQDSIILLALLVIALVALDRGLDLTAGASVGLGLFKFQVVIPIALLFLAWRRWRFSAGFALSAIALAALSVWIVGWAQFEIYVRSILNLGISRSLSSGIQLPVSHMANLHGLVSGIFGDASFAVPLVVTTSAITLALAAIRRPHGAEALGIAITISTVVSYYLFIHDLSVLLIPLVLTLDRFLESEAEGDRGGRIRVRATAALFVAPACMSFVPDHFYLVALPLLFFALVITLPNQVKPVAG